MKQEIANAAVKLQRALANDEGYDPYTGYTAEDIVRWLLDQNCPEADAALRRHGFAKYVEASRGASTKSSPPPRGDGQMEQLTELRSSVERHSEEAMSLVKDMEGRLFECIPSRVGWDYGKWRFGGHWFFNNKGELRLCCNGERVSSTVERGMTFARDLPEVLQALRERLVELDVECCEAITTMCKALAARR